MPIVFVHGVNNRDGAAYRENETVRNGFLREIVAPTLGLSPDNVFITSPYWGDYGAQFAWNMAVLPNPNDKFEQFGGNNDAEANGRVASLVADAQYVGDFLSNAKRDFPGIVDALYASAMAGAKTEEEARDLAKSYLLAADYSANNKTPSWLNTVTEDNFADQLNFVADASQQESFGAGGILDSLKEGLSRLINVLPDAGTELAVRLMRKNLNATVTRFAGDAFTYLKFRGTKENPGKIVQIVRDTLRDASGKKTSNDNKLIVIAHSFGGEITYDILTYFDTNLTVDCLVTVGSQVGLFEEMKLYAESKPNLPPDPPAGKITKLSNVKRWLNVFDVNDVFSYRVEPVFDGASDYYYDTGFSTLSAHGGYFMRPSFYRRLATRLQAV